MMTIRFFQAETGDAAHIRFTGDDGLPHNIFIDSGYERTYGTLIGEAIQDIVDAGEVIDLWVISHIHSDHIGGVYVYVDAINQGYVKSIVEKWMYNSPRVTNEIAHNIVTSEVSESQSIRHGDRLSEYLRSTGKESEIDFISGGVSVDVFGLKIDVVSPDSEALTSLRQKYLDNLNLALEIHESDNVSDATAAKSNDYNRRISEFDLNQKKWVEDDSVENGSSIALIVEHNGKKVLWLADAHPSIVVRALKKLGYSQQNQIECEWVKVCHHGSRANNSNELYELIRCNNYLFSANGLSPNHLPNKEVVAKILRCGTRVSADTYNLFFTYGNDALRNMFAIDGDEVYLQFNFRAIFNSDNKWVDAVL